MIWKSLRFYILRHAYDVKGFAEYSHKNLWFLKILPFFKTKHCLTPNDGTVVVAAACQKEYSSAVCNLWHNSTALQYIYFQFLIIKQ